MEQNYQWPVVHREGLPDLSSGEAAYYQGVQEFNAQSRNIKVVFINQFGFERKLCGNRMPADMEFMDIRKGSRRRVRAEHLRAVRHRAGGADQLRRDLRLQRMLRLRRIRQQGHRRHSPRRMSSSPTTPTCRTKACVPSSCWRSASHSATRSSTRWPTKVAGELIDRLPRTPHEFEQFIDRGYDLAEQMSWDVVARDYVVPGIERATRASRLKQIA